MRKRLPAGKYNKKREKPRGREPKAPETGPCAQDQINLTDEQSRIMPSGDGFIQGYNSQAAVDAESMLIIATDLTTEANDKQRIKPMLEALSKLVILAKTTLRPVLNTALLHSLRWDVKPIIYP